MQEPPRPLMLTRGLAHRTYDTRVAYLHNNTFFAVLGYQRSDRFGKECDLVVRRAEYARGRAVSVYFEKERFHHDPSNLVIVYANEDQVRRQCCDDRGG